jgi:hypothetical protein
VGVGGFASDQLKDTVDKKTLKMCGKTSDIPQHFQQ